MVLRNPESIHPITLPNRKSAYVTCEAERRDRQAALEAQLQAWRVMLPELLEQFSEIPDPRNPNSIQHKSTVLLVFGMMMFVFQVTSRRQANRELTRPLFWDLFQEVFPEVDSIPHADTVNRLLERIDPSELEQTLLQTVKQLLRSGRLDALMVEKQYVIVIDGTQKFVRDWSWAPETLRRRHGEDTSYSAYALEACLVSPQGVRIPFLTEFCENVLDGDEFAKQDSEYKACKRLLARLRKVFPKLRIMIVADGLYPTGPFMALCQRLNLDFMLVLKRDCLPSVWEDVDGLRKLTRDQMRRHQWGNQQQEFWWVNQVEYDFSEEDHRRRIKIHVVGCTETWQEDGEEHTTHWAWVSSRVLTAKNVLERCNRAARHRWGIEETLLTEKHQGYQYEHAFSLKWRAMKNWHTLMHLGHLLNTLTLHTRVLMEKMHVLGIRDTLRFLRETWMHPWVEREQLKVWCKKRPTLRMAL
jgi:hypothetical protein